MKLEPLGYSLPAKLDLDAMKNFEVYEDDGNLVKKEIVLFVKFMLVFLHK